MATAKTETAVTSVTLTLTTAEAEAVLALTGSVSGGMTTGAFYAGPERAAADNVCHALRDALGKSGIDTTFYKSLDKSRRSVTLLPSMPEWERKLLGE